MMRRPNEPIPWQTTADSIDKPIVYLSESPDQFDDASIAEIAAKLKESRDAK